MRDPGPDHFRHILCVPYPASQRDPVRHPRHVHAVVASPDPAILTGVAVLPILRHCHRRRPLWAPEPSPAAPYGPAGSSPANPARRSLLPQTETVPTFPTDTSAPPPARPPSPTAPPVPPYRANSSGSDSSRCSGRSEPRPPSSPSDPGVAFASSAPVFSL